MTDKEYADLAAKALRATTISYPEWERRKQQGKYPDVTRTEWWKALDALGRIGAPQVPAGVAAPGSTGLRVMVLPYSDIPLNLQSSGYHGADIAIDEGSGDSAVLVGSGGRFVSNVWLTRVRIRKAAIGHLRSYGMHGAYLDCFNSELADWDVECSSYADNGLSIRMGGMWIRRAVISGAYFCIGIFDSDTGQSDGTVLLEDVTGTFRHDTAVWCDAQDDFKTTFDLKVTFRRCSFSGPGAFLKAARVRNGWFRFEGCTLNGRPVTAAQVPAGSVIV